MTGNCTAVGFFKQLVELLKLIAVSVLSRFLLDCLFGMLISCQAIKTSKTRTFTLDNTSLSVSSYAMALIHNSV